MKHLGITWVFVALCFGIELSQPAQAQHVSSVWVADQGDGTYKNPILHADYSDPDAVRVGDDYYMTASSFDAVPGLPILHSKDLVNWTLIGHALQRQPPFEHFEKTQHGNGVWAPSIRYHKGEFYIFYGDPDFGIYRIKTKNPAGPWEEPVLVQSAKGIIDVCPLWDEDGRAYLVYAYAGSRAGIKSVLAIKRMDAQATKTLDEGVIIYDGHELDPTIEGPKLYKRDGYYYIFAPAGGVATGWQTVLRSRNIYGPYERRVVMHQGGTAINGPHQGGWVDTQTGEHWFIHFQDKGVYGRVVHLQPMSWRNGWPVIGIDQKGKGIGEPVLTHRKPDVGSTFPVMTPAESDEFDGIGMGLQWQWQANPKTTWAFCYPQKGVLRLYSQQLPEGSRNLYETPNVLMQKFPAPAFTVTAKVTFAPHPDKVLGERAGLVIMGRSYAALMLRKDTSGLSLVQAVAINAHEGKPEQETVITKLETGSLYLRVSVTEGGLCRFYHSTDGTTYQKAGEPFQAVEGHWIGAKIGLFSTRTETINDAGWMDVDWFRITPPDMEGAQSAKVDSVADRMLLLQRSYGGWSKTFNGKPVDYRRSLTENERRLALKQKEANDATIDNGATAKEIMYLLDAYRRTGNIRYAEAARRGVDYLLKAQYPGGGWPQYFPDTSRYRSQITYNDNAIINVLTVLKAIAEGQHETVFGKSYQEKAQKALDQGLQNILATQLTIDGERTIWAAQYDKDSLKPATARAYELPSLATSESAGILAFLMSLNRPDKNVALAVDSGVRWFTEHGIAGYTSKIVNAPGQPTGKDRILVRAPGHVIWARFYDLVNQQPLFAGRDDRPRARLDEVENERRVGYAWYGTWGSKVINQYQEWKTEHP